MDRHPLVHAGVEAVLRGRHGLAHAGSAGDRYALWPLLQRTHPDVVLLEHGPGSDGLELCLRLTGRANAPHVVLHGGAGGMAHVAAAFAGADALLDPEAPTRELVETLRAVGAGERRLPELSLPTRTRAAATLAPGDRAVLAMRLAGASRADIAEVARLHPAELHGRLAAIAARLAGRTDPAPVPVPARRLRAVA
jgi:DNA-binding NarL/FixJ family response regulator